jgi:hypothetical protein
MTGEYLRVSARRDPDTGNRIVSIAREGLLIGQLVVPPEALGDLAAVIDAAQRMTGDGRATATRERGGARSWEYRGGGL